MRFAVCLFPETPETAKPDEQLRFENMLIGSKRPAAACPTRAGVPSGFRGKINLYARVAPATVRKGCLTQYESKINSLLAELNLKPDAVSPIIRLGGSMNHDPYISEVRCPVHGFDRPDAIGAGHS